MSETFLLVVCMSDGLATVFCPVIFVCFAPLVNPKIAVGILIENAGFGSTWAGPIARLMMEKYLKGKITRPDLEKRMIEGDLIHKIKPKPIEKKKRH